MNRPPLTSIALNCKKKFDLFQLGVELKARKKIGPESGKIKGRMKVIGYSKLVKKIKVVK